MAGAEIRRYSADQRGLSLNVFLGVAGGALGTLAETLILPTIVLAFFVGQLTDSYAVVGLVPALGVGLWALARLPATILIASRRRKLPWAIGAALVRAAATGLLAIVSFRAGEGSEPQLLRAFFICYAAYSFAAGFASVPISSVIAKAMPHEGRLIFFRQRTLWSGVMGVIAGLVVVQLLGNGSPPFRREFALIFLAATVCQLATAFFISTLREPRRIPEVGAPNPLAILQMAPRAFADSNYRRFVVFRLFLSLSTLIDPFLIIFAVAQLAVAPATVGGYVIALVVGRIGSAPLWAVFARRHGEKATLQVAALLRLIAPLMALVLPYVAATDLYRERVTDRDALAMIFGIAFVALGAAIGGQARGNFSYLAEIAPSRLRTVYTGLTNGTLVVIAIAPIAGGLIIDRYGYEALFLTTALISLIAVFASGALTDTHVRTRRSAAAWRLRRPVISSPETQRR